MEEGRKEKERGQIEEGRKGMGRSKAGRKGGRKGGRKEKGFAAGCAPRGTTQNPENTPQRVNGKKE